MMGARRRQDNPLEANFTFAEFGELTSVAPLRLRAPILESIPKQATY